MVNKESIVKIVKNDVVLSVQFLVWFLSFIFIFLSYCYSDTISIIQYQRNFAKLLLEGNVLDFYEYTYALSLEKGYSAATYDFLMNAIFGIWGIPIYLLEQVFSLDSMTNAGLLIYGKSLMLVFLIISSVYVYKITLIIIKNKNTAVYASFIFNSSLLVYTAIGYIGQSDILGITIILMGLEAYLLKKNIKFLIYFALAITCKQYALFIFIPLLILIHKEIYKIVIYLSGALLPTLCSNVLFDSGSASMIRKKEFAEGMLGKLLSNKLPFGHNGVSVVVVLLLIFYIIIYLKKIDTEDEFFKYAIFIPLTSMILLFVSFPSFPYWYLYITPFFAIICVMNTSKLKENLLFETVAMISLFCQQLSEYYWCFDIKNVTNMVLNSMISGKTLVSFNNVIHYRDMISYNLRSQGEIVLESMWVVFMCSIIVLNLPSTISSKKENRLRKYVCNRFIVNVAVVYIPIYLLIVLANR